ncbi:MAG: GNAT family N-acetyltransferase [Tissierellia bacterium]|nr:GNAT family N-acetyltransferase [Tissierellia bacterium]
MNKEDFMDYKIEFREDENRSVAIVDDKIVGECDFKIKGEDWDIVHTGVDPEYRGGSIAIDLLNAVVENARSKGKKIIPTCPYVLKKFKKDESYNDIWKK